MSTPGHSSNLCRILSETNHVISSNSRHFLALSVIFILPLSLVLNFYHYLLNLKTNLHQLHTFDANSLFSSFSSSPDPQAENSYLLITLFYSLFALIFSLFTTASITHSTFHGFYNRPLDFVSSFKSALFSFFPLLATVMVYEIILILIFCVFGLFGALVYGGLVTSGVDVDYGSNCLLVLIICMTILFLLVAIYLQVKWSLAFVVVVVESEWGLSPLKRSAYLIKGMKRIALSIMLFYGALNGILSSAVSALALYLGGVIGGWGFIPPTLLISGLMAVLMLYCVATYTVLCIHCKVLRGESEFETPEESSGDYVSFPVDDGKVPQVVYVNV